MKGPDVTVITSVFSMSEDALRKQDKMLRKQSYSGKLTHILINDNSSRKLKLSGCRVINHSKNLGLAKTLNAGFKLAKTEIIVSLMDDCMPSSRDWLKKLISSFKDKSVAAVTSDVELPEPFWSRFSYFARALTEKEQRVLTPGLDEKGCAYRKSALKEFGYLNEKEFANGGEDTDLTVKIEQSTKWKIVHSRAKIFHYHYFTAKSRIKKEIQYARLSGLISRKHFFRLPWNFQAHVAARLLVALFFIISLFNLNYFAWALVLVILISNVRLSSQARRLGLSPRLIAVASLNVYIYSLYVINYSYGLLFKPRV